MMNRRDFFKNSFTYLAGMAVLAVTGVPKAAACDPPKPKPILPGFQPGVTMKVPDMRGVQVAAWVDDGKVTSGPVEVQTVTYNFDKGEKWSFKEDWLKSLEVPRQVWDGDVVLTPNGAFVAEVKAGVIKWEKAKLVLE